MTIEQLLNMSVGQKTGGFKLTIKKYPCKEVIVGKKTLLPVVFIDETGEIPGEILLKKRVTLQKGWEVHIVVGIIQQGESGKKLYVDQWWLPTMTVAEMEARNFDIQQEIKYGEPINVVKSKCVYGLVRDYRALNDFEAELPEEAKRIIESDLNYITKFIKGE